MAAWASDDELFAAMAGRLYAGVVADVLDRLGHRDQAMAPEIRPLAGAVIVGRAMPMRAVEVEVVPDDPYRGEIAALDDLRPNEVAVVAADGTRRAALWGELFSHAAQARGARGAILDGYHRDDRLVRGLGFPLASRGTLPLDCNGRTATVAHREPVVCGGVPVAPGDVVFGDEDGVVVVPAALVQAAVVAALEKVGGENQARAAIRQGVSMREAFDRYRVL